MQSVTLSTMPCAGSVKSHPTSRLSARSRADNPRPARQQQRIAAEYKRLKREDKSLQCLLKSMLWALSSPFLASSEMMSLTDTFVLKRYLKTRQYLRDRAMFNITGNPDALNAHLPYRQKLSAHPLQSGLGQYDELVQDILHTAQFYETTTEGYKAFCRRNALLDTQPEHLAQWLPHTAPDLTPLSDPSLRYLVAGQIAELIHRRPEYSLWVLQNDIPLRFFISKDVPRGNILGSYTPQFHTIHLNAPSMNLIVEKSLMAQHEFVHALSAADKHVPDVLPMMNNNQIKRYQVARDALNDLHAKQFQSPLGRLRFWLTGHTKTGLVNHAFTNHQEFLAVSLDAFRNYPKTLCKTQAGRVLCALYQEVFSLDPLRDFSNT